jgi:DNA modification methylase
VNSAIETNNGHTNDGHTNNGYTNNGLGHDLIHSLTTGIDSPVQSSSVQAMQMENEIARSMNTPHISKAHRISKAQRIALTAIRLDGETRMRVDDNPFVADEYSRLMADNVCFPPVIVFQDEEQYWLADGFYRVAAARQLEREAIMALVKPGTRRDARLFAIAANTVHGSRYTTKDKRHAVLTLLADPEWRDWSNYQIARHCGVTEGTVRKYRDEVAVPSATQNTQTRKYLRGGKTHTMNVGGLSMVRAAKTQIPPIPPACTATTNSHTTTSASPSLQDLSSDVLDRARELSLVNDPAQVSALLAIAPHEQQQIVTLIADKKAATVAEAQLQLQRQREKDAKADAIKERTKQALAAGWDSHFVCGDCTQELSALEAQSVRLLLADGPYGVNFCNNNRVATPRSERISGDESLEEALDVHRRMLQAVEHAMMPDCHVMLFCDKRFEPEFRQLLCEAGYTFKDSLIWDKGDGGRPIKNQAYRRHERILWYTKGSPVMVEKIADVLCHRRPSREPNAFATNHPTPKSVSLMQELIRATTVVGERVVDPFAGSATTLAAAKSLGRCYFGVEEKTDWHAEGMARLLSVDSPAQETTLAVASASCLSLIPAADSVNRNDLTASIHRPPYLSLTPPALGVAANADFAEDLDAALPMAA